MPRHALPDSAYPTDTASVDVAPIDIASARHRRRHAAATAPRRRRRPAPEPAPVAPIVIPAPRRAADDHIAGYADAPLFTHDDEPVVDEPDRPSAPLVTAPAPAAARNRHRLPPRSRRTGFRMPRPVGKRKQAAAVLVATTAGIIGVPSAGAAAVDECRWMRAAHQLVIALDDGDNSQQAQQLRKALDKAGVGPDLPEKCIIDTTQYLPAAGADQDGDKADTGADTGADEEAPTPAPTGPKHAKPDTEESPAPAPTTAAPKPATPKPAPKPAPQAADATTAGAGTTAAEKFGWGTPVKVDDFTSGLDGWNIYDGPGHAGNGRRTPDAASAENGMLTINGSSAGATAGMAWGEGQKYGRWEGRVKAPASDESYNALLLLWPDAENFPVGGEIDFMEMMDHTRQTTNMFLHYGADNSQVDGEVNIDGTQWHNWAVEWTPDHVATFVDGKEWFRTTDKSILPPGPMHLCIQLDWFPGDGNGSVQESQMQVDWVKQYSL